MSQRREIVAGMLFAMVALWSWRWLEIGGADMVARLVAA